MQAKGDSEVAMKEYVGDPFEIALIPGSVEAELMAQGTHVLLCDRYSLRAQIQGAPVGVVAWRQLDRDKDDDRQGRQHDEHDDEALDQIFGHRSILSIHRRPAGGRILHLPGTRLMM
jgi:hypothetical protein